MANFTLADIKALREQLGTGMVDTKKALDEADGDIEKAVEILRLKGAKGNAKRADRSTSEGLVAAVEHGDGTVTLIELACETDFVAKNDRFIALADKVLAAAAAAARRLRRGRPRRARRRQDRRRRSSTTRPRSSARRSSCAASARVSGEQVRDLPAQDAARTCPRRSASSLAYTGDDAETARSIAQHISFANPTYLTRDDVPAAEVEKEREIVTEISRNEGKPEAALPKIVEGRVSAFFKQVALLEQDYAKDNKLSVAQGRQGRRASP